MNQRSCNTGAEACGGEGKQQQGRRGLNAGRRLKNRVEFTDYEEKQEAEEKAFSRRHSGGTFRPPVTGQRRFLRNCRGKVGLYHPQIDALEVVGYDRDGIPEYMGVCEWADFEFYECCPFCGCFCGMHFQEASYMYHCVNCDTLTNFEDLRE